MGLFDFLLKKKTKPSVSVSTSNSDYSATEQIVKMYNDYNPNKKYTLPRNENYATAAFLRHCQSGKPIGSSLKEYPDYLSRKYKINDPIKYHKSLIDNGFLEEASFPVLLKKYKISEIQDILKSKNIIEKGKKEDLIQKVCENFSIDELHLTKIYIPTEKGIEHLNRFNFIFTLEYLGINPDNYDTFVKLNKLSPLPNDRIWALINCHYMYYSAGQYYGLARNEVLNMAKLVSSENKNKDALYYYINVLYYDTSGLNNSGTVSKKESVLLAPGIVSEICQLKEHFDVDMVRRCYEQSLPHHYLSIQSFKNLIEDIFEDKVIDINNYC